MRQRLKANHLLFKLYLILRIKMTSKIRKPRRNLKNVFENYTNMDARKILKFLRMI